VVDNAFLTYNLFFYSILMMFWLFCAFMTCVFELLLASCFLWSGYYPFFFGYTWFFFLSKHEVKLFVSHNQDCHTIAIGFSLGLCCQLVLQSMFERRCQINLVWFKLYDKRHFISVDKEYFLTLLTLTHQCQWNLQPLWVQFVW
jgi:hypothetical protein